MKRILSRLFGVPADGRARGLVYAALSRDDGFAGVVPGQVVRYARPGPPWIVVAHAPAAVIVARWPGKLWEVETLETAPEADQPRAGAGYTRAFAVRMIREIPVSILFGEHGDAVVRVIDRAGSLDAGDAAALGLHATDAAREAYSRAWKAWLGAVDPESFHLESDHGATLAVFADATASPIGGGFMVLGTVLRERARAVAGDAAFTASEDEEEGEWLDEPWGSALDALLAAAMALGAPQLVPEADRRDLLEAWEACFGA